MTKEAWAGCFLLLFVLAVLALGVLVGFLVLGPILQQIVKSL